MKYKVNSLVTRDFSDLTAPTDNIYESVAIISKRARQVSLYLKEDLDRKLADFINDDLEELDEEEKLEEQEQKLNEIKGEQAEIGWGNQIRSYVFHPYSLVKDHRTSVENGNVQAVMDGSIHGFMEAFLQKQVGK